jgi:hypothetical protein
MRTLTLLTVALGTLTGAARLAADDKKGTVVELAGMKSAAPAEWKEEQPTSNMRLTQFKVPKAAGDKEDAEVAVFFFRGGGSGTVDQNLKRQVAKFQPAAGKDKVEETIDKGFKVGSVAATYQDVKGTFVKKPFPMAEKGTPFPDYRQLYVVFENADGQYYVWLLGPAKTVEQHKKGFDEWLKNFK